VHSAGCPATLANKVSVKNQVSLVADPDLRNNIAAANTSAFLDDFNRPNGAPGDGWDRG
jgi:hypothetical protein